MGLKIEPKPSKSVSWRSKMAVMGSSRKSDLETGLSGEIIEEYCMETTMHGFKDMIKSGTLRRSLWSALLVSMVVLMIYQAQTQFRLYISHPVSTNIAIKYPEELPFPVILFCNTNKYRISYVREHNLFELLQAVYSLNGTGKETILKSYNIDSLPYSNDSRLFLIDAAHQLDDMLIRCFLPNGHRCSAKDFNILLTDYGVCYTWNNDRKNPMKVHTGGAETDLYMMLNIEAYERTPGITRSIGLKVLIFDQTTDPSVSQGAIDVSPGYQFYISFHKIEKQRVGPEDGGTCVDSLPLAHFTDDRPYSYDTCKIDKVIQKVVQQCGCLPYNAPDYQETWELTTQNKSVVDPPLCTVKQHMECVVHHKSRNMVNSGCLQNCHSIKLKPTISFAKNPSEVGYKSMTIEQAASFKQRYYKAIEALQRLDPDAIKQTQDVIDKVYSVRDWLKENRLEPKFTTFESSRTRLLKLECYYNMSRDTNFLYRSLKTAKVGVDSYVSILHILHPEIPLKSLIVNRDTYLEQNQDELDRTISKVIDMVRKLKQLTGFFRSSTFTPEMTMKVEEYQITFDEIELYLSHNLTKIELANRITILQNLKAGITSGIIDPMNKNIVSNLLWYAQISNYSVEVEELKVMLTDSTNSRLLMQMLVPMADRQTACVKEVKNVIKNLQDDIYNTDFYINSVCPPEIAVEGFPEIIDQMKSCLFGDVRKAVVELSDKIQQMKPRLVQAFSDITLYLQNFASDMGATSSNHEGNFVALNFYYSDLSVEQQIQSRSYSFWSFLCDIGGTLGLFLGASIITIYELIDFFILKPLFRYIKVSNQINGNHKN